MSKKASKKSTKTVYSKTSPQPGLPGRLTKNAINNLKAPKKMGPKDLLCPDGCAWLEQLTSVFDGHETTLVDMPLAENSWGCPSALGFNYGSAEIAPVNSQASIWGYPGGVRKNTEVTDGETAEVTFTGAHRANVGSIVGNVNGLSNGTMCGWADGNQPNIKIPSGSIQSIDFAPLTTPVAVGDNTTAFTGVQQRTVAFGIRVSYIGRLADTEGYIEFVMPAEYMGYYSTATIDEMRVDATYRRHFYGTERTHTFYWTPNCDDVKYMENQGDNKHASVNLDSRFMLRLGGMQSGDKYLVEVAAIQGFAGKKVQALQIPRPVSTDAQYIINTLQTHRGAHHSLTDTASRKVKARGKQLAMLAAGHKARATPALSYLANGAQFLSKNWKTISEVGHVGRQALSYLAAAI
jgi:hypothetical protein